MSQPAIPPVPPWPRETLEATPWAARFLEDAPLSYRQAIECALEPDLEVELFETDKNGEPQWVIALADDNGFWMDALETRAEALSLCAVKRWRIYVIPKQPA